MTLQQRLEDWIGADEPVTTKIGKGSISLGTVVFTNRFRAELRASLPTLLAQIERHVLEGRRKEIQIIKVCADKSNYTASEYDLVITDRLRVLDALLNTKGEPDDNQNI